MNEPLHRVLLVCEGPSDVRRVRAVVAAWLRAEVDWCDGYDDEDLLECVGLEDGDDYFPVKQVPAFARERVGSGFGAPMGHGDGRLIRRFLLALHKDSGVGDRAGLIVWLRDGDGDGSREPAARAERDRLEAGLPAPVVIGYGHQCLEAWVIGGFEPGDDDEKQRADAACAVLGRSHLVRTWDITHKDVEGGAKDVCRILVAGDEEREKGCLLALAREPSERRDCVGLTHFLTDLERRWKPIIHGPPSP